MRHITTILLLFFCIAVNAQETAKIRVTFELDNLSNNKKFRAKNAWALDIGDTTAIFYTPNERNAVPLIDSIKKESQKICASLLRNERKYSTNIREATLCRC